MSCCQRWEAFRQDGLSSQSCLRVQSTSLRHRQGLLLSITLLPSILSQTSHPPELFLSPPLFLSVSFFPHMLHALVWANPLGAQARLLYLSDAISPAIYPPCLNHLDLHGFYRLPSPLFPSSGLLLVLRESWDHWLLCLSCFLSPTQAWVRVI